jgi:hypothetical protein
MNFTIEEINFICIVNGKDREETLDNIFDVMPDIEDEEMKDIAESVIGKLESISDSEYDEFAFEDNYAD